MAHPLAASASKRSLSNRLGNLSWLPHANILSSRSFSSLVCKSLSSGQLRIPLPTLPGQVLTLGLAPMAPGLLRRGLAAPAHKSLACRRLELCSFGMHLRRA